MMHFKKLNQTKFNDLVMQYPHLLSTSVLYKNNYYNLGGIDFRYDTNDKEYVLICEKDTELSDLTTFMDTHNGECSLLGNDNIMQFFMENQKDNKLIYEVNNTQGCFKNKDEYILIRLSNDTFVFNMILSKQATLLNNLSFKERFSTTVAKDMMNYLIQSNLLGIMYEYDFNCSGMINYNKVVLLPNESKIIKNNEVEDNLHLETLMHSLILEKDFLDKAVFKVKYDYLDGHLSYAIQLIDKQNKNVLIFHILPNI